MISRGAGVDVADPYGNTALHLAARTGSLETVRLLVGCGADTRKGNGKLLGASADLITDAQTETRTRSGRSGRCATRRTIVFRHSSEACRPPAAYLGTLVYTHPTVVL